MGWQMPGLLAELFLPHFSNFPAILASSLLWFIHIVGVFSRRGNRMPITDVTLAGMTRPVPPTRFHKAVRLPKVMVGTITRSFLRGKIYRVNKLGIKTEFDNWNEHWAYWPLDVSTAQLSQTRYPHSGHSSSQILPWASSSSSSSSP